MCELSPGNEIRCLAVSKQNVETIFPFRIHLRSAIFVFDTASNQVFVSDHALKQYFCFQMKISDDITCTSLFLRAGKELILQFQNFILCMNEYISEKKTDTPVLKTEQR